MMRVQAPALRRPGLRVGVSMLALGGMAFMLALRRISRRWICPKRVTFPPVAGVEEVRFAAADGTPLYGWFLPAPPNADVDERPPSGLVLCHGYQSGLFETSELGDALRRRGFNVLLFDFRACGRSGGRFTTIGLREPEDVRGALRWLRERLGPGAALGVYGLSMGGAAALSASAAEPTAIRALVLDSAFATLAVPVRLRMQRQRPWMRPLFRLSMAAAEWQVGARVRMVRPIDAARALTGVPALLIHGDADTTVPPSESRRLVRALPGPAELWTLPGCGHVEGRFLHPEAYVERVASFLMRVLPAAP